MDSFFHIQGSPASPLAPLILIHAVSGFALPYLSLGPLSPSPSPSSSSQQPPRPVYGLSSPIYESKSYCLPASFAALAREYVTRLRRELPQGPYVLGGWSMGGMVAVKMAEMLELEGQVVRGVVLIDCANPVGYPAFRDQGERGEVAEWTYGAYKGRSGLGGLEDMEAGGEEEGGGISDSGEEEDDDDDDDDDEVDVMEYLPRMRKHIYNSLDLIARAGQGGYMPQALRSPVTLVKCTQLATLPGAMSEERKKAIRLRFEDERAGWAMMEKFKSTPVHAMHDNVFDEDHVGELTEILRGVLGEIR